MVLFSFGWTPIQALYPAEVLAYENRAKGLALQGIVTNSVSLINTFGLPPALVALGWKSKCILSHEIWDMPLTLPSLFDLLRVGHRRNRHHLLLRRRDQATLARGHGQCLQLGQPEANLVRLGSCGS